MKNRIAIAGCAAGLLFAFQGAGAAFGAAANPPAYIAAAIADSHRPPEFEDLVKTGDAGLALC